jgi:hypothetical protein
MGNIQKRKAVVYRHGRALIQYVYTRRGGGESWVYVNRDQHLVRPHPNGRGYEVIEPCPRPR